MPDIERSSDDLRPHRTVCGMDYHEPDNDSACTDPDCPGRVREDDDAR